MTKCPWHQRALFQSLVVAVLLAVVVGAIVVSVSPASHAQAVGRGAAVAPVSLKSAFSLLRRPAAGPPPGALVEALAHVPAGFHLDVAGARRAATTGAWLIPGEGGVCIAVRDAEGLGVSCSSVASAERGELAFQEVSVSEGESTVFGAVPDWTPRVSVRSPDGLSVVAATVRESTYAVPDVSTSGPLRIAEGSVEREPQP